MKKWYHVELGNEHRKDALCKFLRRSGYRFECKQDPKKPHYDWWRVSLQLDDDERDAVNDWLRTH